jgi:hypothetical protein
MLKKSVGRIPNNKPHDNHKFHQLSYRLCGHGTWGGLILQI